MKLRIRGNSVRLRLTRREVAQFSETGIVEEAVVFGAPPEQRLIYALETADGEKIRATFRENRLSVSVPRAFVEDWANSDRVGFEAEQPIGGGENLRILVEKDFACLEARPGEDEADAFPHPLEGAAC